MMAGWSAWTDEPREQEKENYQEKEMESEKVGEKSEWDERSSVAQSNITDAAQ